MTTEAHPKLDAQTLEYIISFLDNKSEEWEALEWETEDEELAKELHDGRRMLTEVRTNIHEMLVSTIETKLEQFYEEHPEAMDGIL